MKRFPKPRSVVAAAFVALTVLGLSISSNEVRAAAVTALGKWSVATDPGSTGAWYAVDYANGQWVALGHSSEVAVSPDGATWTVYPVPAGQWQSVAYGNGQYVALSSVSGGDEEIVSSNGINWTEVRGPVGPWTALTFGGGQFVAVSAHGQVVTSSDGESWTTVWSHSNYDLTSVAYGDGSFVATDAALGATLISDNGSDWSRILPSRSGLQWGAVAYGNGNFVGLGGSSAGYVETSVYGHIWTLHTYSPEQAVDAATFGCGEFVAVGQPTDSANSIISSQTGVTWSASPVPTDVASDWTAVAYGAGRFVAVDSSGTIAWASTLGDCAAAIPSPPRQVSGNVHSGEVWTYMHPAVLPGGAPVNSYRVTITDGSVTRHCPAAVYFQPNCIIRGLENRQVYWVTAQAHNRFGYSVMTDPEFVIPVATWSLDAMTTQAVIAGSSPVVVQLTGVIANSQGIYPTSLITIHFGSELAYCHANPFGECLVSIPDPPVGVDAIYATYTGYGRSYVSPTNYVTITP